MTQQYEGTHLTGLAGTNPLGFFAALGVQVLFADEPHQPKLWWSNDVIPHAIVDKDFSVETIIQQALAVCPKWANSPAVSPRFGKKDDPGISAAKFSEEDTHTYLLQALASGEPSAALATALVAEGSYAVKAGKNVSKPTDLYFTAAKQLFLKNAQTILSSVTQDDLHNGLVGPWLYESKLPSLMWDVTDDRNYALLAFDPAGDKKLTNPGAEALAILGLSRHPVFAGKAGQKTRTLTVGCSGQWKSGEYTWPLWSRPTGNAAVSALLVHASHPKPESRSNWYPSWGIFQVLQSQITRSDQGGFGTFSPPRIVWKTNSESS